MDRGHIVQRYFDGWNAHDADAIVATFAEGGTYQDPTTPGPVSGAAIGENAESLWAAFPDVSFETTSTSHVSTPDGSIAAEWVMKGTNAGSFMGLPPTQREVVVHGADFIHADESGIRAVRGYFDAGVVPRQLGLQVVVQPHAVGPFLFGTGVRVGGEAEGPPGAFSITCLFARSDEEAEQVQAYSRQIAAEMPQLEGFMGFVGSTIAGRMMTITAWKTPEDSRRLMKEGVHPKAVQDFFGPELAAGGWTSVWTPDRVNPLWARCESCGAMKSRIEAVAPASVERTSVHPPSIGSRAPGLGAAMGRSQAGMSFSGTAT